jgi:hypothetical protein
LLPPTILSKAAARASAQQLLPAKGAIAVILPYDQVTDEELKRADVIIAVDPRDGSSRQVYGQESIAAFRPHPAGPNEVRILEVELSDTDQPAFEALCRRVFAAKMAQKAENAKELAWRHYQTEPGLTQVIRFSGAPTVEATSSEPIKLLEVNTNTIPSGVMPLHFGPVRASGFVFPSVIIEVTPEEFVKIQSHELKLPRGWEFDEVLPKPPDASGDHDGDKP